MKHLLLVSSCLFLFFFFSLYKHSQVSVPRRVLFKYQPTKAVWRGHENIYNHIQIDPDHQHTGANSLKILNRSPWREICWSLIFESILKISSTSKGKHCRKDVMGDRIEIIMGWFKNIVDLKEICSKSWNKALRQWEWGRYECLKDQKSCQYQLEKKNAATSSRDHVQLRPVTKHSDLS